MAVKVAINGFGRIGRLLVRLAHKRDDIDIVAINSRADSHTLAHLLKYDSVHGTLDAEVDYTDDALKIDGNAIHVSRVSDDLSKISWGDLGVEIVVESTGKLRNREQSQPHIDSGAKKVIISAPGKKMDGTFVFGVNHETYDPGKHTIVSNASCTTNCLAPVAKVLNENFTIVRGLMTTIHSYTMDQRLLDGSHKDLRRGRAAAMSMVPTTTGAAVAVGQVIPELAGKLDGLAIRVPTPNVSLVDLVVEVKKKTSVKEVNQAMKAAADGLLKGILAYIDAPLVSVDFTSSPYSSLFDAEITSVMEDTMVKVLSWYDNEAGYAARTLDMAVYMASKGL